MDSTGPARDAASTTPDTPEGPVCVVEGLRVGLTGRGLDVVEDVDLVVSAGEVLGLVGESGSGKTTTGTALLGYARTGAEITGGRIDVAGHDLRSMSWQQVRAVRGLDVGYVPQDPSSALNPAIRIGQQLRELLDLHSIGTPQERDERVREILPEVGLPADDAFLRRYPHQLSGGQVQRVALAMVFLPRPAVLVLDEPTTGLDVTTQGKVLDTLGELCRRFDVAALYVTHDLSVVATIADRVAVMYAGQVVEVGATRAVFAEPAHPYTRALLRAIPHLHKPYALSGIPGLAPAPGRRPDGCRFNDRCEHAVEACRATQPALVEVSRTGGESHVARCIRVDELPPWDPEDRAVSDTVPDREREIVLEVAGLDVSYGRTQVVHDVSFDLARREIVALVGESGSGKTTTSRCVAGLHQDWTGRIELEGEQLVASARRRSPEQRKRVQYIFQNPYQSLNPRRTVEQILTRPLALFGIARGRAARERSAELLDQVQLDPSLLRLRAGRLSGGERQRVAIARALAAEPDVLVCDEITSALDVSIQGSITALLDRIKAERGISMLFVTHDLALVRSIADRIVVLSDGRVVEQGLTAQVLDHPQEDYTRELLAHTPQLANAFD
ncbi:MULTISPECIES: ABC transporter ATP-binding protein [Arsenicicoccus]|uniref:ABC transporter ATP-binding protein n=1 Tax=Arsenicicoccus TaxID=267408 RepID=UPI00257CB96F|nr:MULTISPECIES: ABC transporter ATP-binding protein [Arsenicicoccus]